jgi:colanic acid/amylovoran biosynthesis glycosyltransferase
MQAVERTGWRVVPVAIRRERGELEQPGAAVFAARLRAISDATPGELVAAQVRLLRRSPGAWAGLWTRAIGGTIASPKFLARAIVVAAGAPLVAEHVSGEQVEHLHAHWGTHSALLAHLVARLTGMPYSVTLHAHDLHVDRTMLGTKLREAAAVVTISDHNAALLRREYPDVADRVHVVHCGLAVGDVPYRPPAPPATASPADAPIRLVTVAGLRPFKGHRVLLGAIRELERRGRSVRCDLVGDGPLRDELRADAGGLDVEFHGAVTVDRAMDVVAAADVFVMPSVALADGRRDGIPVALMEAMALGVPVIASSVSGIPELVRDGDTGLLVPQGDPVALADAIERLAADPAGARAMSASARALVADEFDIDRSGQAMTRLFDPVRLERSLA